jgi:hypothetical protein
MTEEEKEMLLEDLGDEDWALIINKDGQLKGMAVPELDDKDMVHENIIAILSILDPELAKEIDEEYERMLEEQGIVDDEDIDPTGKTVH